MLYVLCTFHTIPAILIKLEILYLPEMSSMHCYRHRHLFKTRRFVDLAERHATTISLILLDWEHASTNADGENPQQAVSSRKHHWDNMKLKAEATSVL